MDEEEREILFHKTNEVLNSSMAYLLACAINVAHEFLSVVRSEIVREISLNGWPPELKEKTIGEFLSRLERDLTREEGD